jgi:uncharacterized membrane protein
MTQDEIEREFIGLREQISKLQQRQERLQTKLARWALAFFGVFIVLTAFTWFTYGKANPGEYGFAMTFMYMALAFGSLAQPGGSVWSRPK